MYKLSRRQGFLALLLILALLPGTTAAAQELAWKGAGIGGVVGAAIGTYMDRQQERFVHIPGTAVERMGDDTLLVRFSSDALFDSGSATLDPAGCSTLDRVADVVNDYRKTAVVVQGHTDSTGIPERSQDLSERRARAVRKYLLDRGVEPERVTAAGYGATAPVADNGTETGRRKNRRVDVLLKARRGPLRGY